MNIKKINLVAILITPLILSCNLKSIQNNLDVNKIDDESQNISTPTNTFVSQTPKPQKTSYIQPEQVESVISISPLTLIENKLEVIVKSITVKPASLSLKVGQVVEFQVIVNMSDGSTNKNTRINVLNSNIIELQQNFKLLGKSEGQTKVEITDIVDTSKKTTIDIIVVKAEEPIPPPKIVVESISLSEQNLSLSIGENKKINAEVKLTDNSTNNRVNWSSSDNTILTIGSDGTITTIKEGLAIVTANSQTEPDKKVSIPVAINKPITNSTPIVTPTPKPTINPTPILTSNPTSTPSPTPIVTPIINPTSTPVQLKGKVTFISERDGNKEIYIMNVDGSNQNRITNNNYADISPNWSPNGDKIIFSSTREKQNIYIVNEDGSNEVLLSNDINRWDSSPTWSSDGKKIYLYCSFMNTSNNIEKGIYKIDSNGNNLEKIIKLNDIHVSDLNLSSDNKKLVFSGNFQGSLSIYVVNVDGSDLKQLTKSSLDMSPNWSKDSQKIVFSSIRNGNFEIYIMDQDGSNLKRLTNNSFIDNNPSFSPDGTKIIFNSNIDVNGFTPEIYIMDLDGSNLKRLTNNNDSEYYPKWHQ